ncbi:MAG: seryl-tRNA synthetase [Gammaproteobacteria bacterium]|jgi:seryl-tRNA synthetase|nr:seryl-tRNA synthetase [Gammaproteobacteria bacterium]
MLDQKYYRQDLPVLAEALAKRGFSLDIAYFQSLEAKRKELQTKTESLQSERNQLAKAVGQKKAKGENADELLKTSEALAQELKANEVALTALLAEIRDAQLRIPNMPDASVPLGKDENDNLEIKTWGEPRAFDFTPKDHVDLALARGWADFDKAAQLASARFVVLHGPLAKLQRALIQFMLDLHTNAHGYQEVYVPYLVNAESLYGTGQLPKFEEDQFKTNNEPALYLIPTAEVPVTNLARDTIFAVEELPKKYVAHTPCFRSEAGSYGKDTRGLIRQHQFEKVELVQFVAPDQSEAAHEALTSHAETILEQLELPYRRVLLCGGDMGFASSKTYDLEVWLPGQQKYREISSCSNFKDFQARRLQARWRNPASNKPEYLHTLNGSGLAVGRTLVAILENYQQADGSVKIPTVLVPYLGKGEL